MLSFPSQNDKKKTFSDQPGVLEKNRQGENLNHQMFITAFLQFQSKDQREPHNKVESQSQAQQLVGFEPGTFRF